MFTRIVLPALALACAAPVLAQPVTMEVPYGDLDLTKDAGRETLEHRLDRAARQVCGGQAGRGVAEMRRFRTCIADARTSYRGQVELALQNANARRVAVLADKLGMLASF